MSHEGPPTRPPSLRARNADRDETLSVLGTAYAEGQLTTEEHEARVARALVAPTLGDLVALTADLTPDAESSVLLRRDPRTLAQQHPRLVPAVAGAICVITVGALLLGALGGQKEMEAAPVDTTPVVVDAPVVEDEPVVEEEPPQPRYDPLTVPALQEFVDAYDEEFGTTRIYDASFRDDGHVSFEALHGPARKNRLQGWHWDPVEGFSSSDTPSANVFSYAPVDLARVDLEALVRNLEHARKYLNVEDPDSIRFVLNRREIHDDPASIRIYVTNRFDESAWMSTSLNGEISSSSPFSPDGR